MIPRKKAQAAMEFILTYGWALLVVIIAISALAYFGVLDVEKWFPSSCMIEPGITCLDHELTFIPGLMGGPDTNNLELIIRNNVGSQIENIIVRLPQWNKEKSFNTIRLENNQKNINGEIKIDDVTNGHPAYKRGDKYEIDFIISVEHTQSGLTHNYQGTVKGMLK